MLPTFETQRLIVRPLTLRDFNACLAMDSDPEVVRYIDVPWTDAKSHRTFLHQRITRSYPDGLGYWSVVLKPIALHELALSDSKKNN
jgi:RimJ/RimL family protein N-acetyltransferase